MMQLTCPWCGPRPEPEFRCGGPAGIVRPPLDCSDEAWAAYLYERDNPMGAQAERWCHGFGCGQWFTLRRDTLTHAVELGGTGPADGGPPTGPAP